MACRAPACPARTGATPALKRQPGLYVLPFGAVTEHDLAALEAQIAAHPRWLLDHLRALQPPDDALVLLDTPPGPSAYGRQALGIAHWVMVVMLADAASYATLPLMQRLVQTHCAPRTDFRGYVLSAQSGELPRQALAGHPARAAEAMGRASRALSMPTRPCPSRWRWA